MMSEETYIGKAEIKGGKVVNLIVVDPANIPEWCADWPTAEGPDAVIGATYSNGVFTRPSEET